MLRAITAFALLALPAAAAAQQPCTVDARFVVDQVYRTVLERSPDRSAEADFARRLSDGSMTVKDIVRELASSAEHRQRFGTGGNAAADQQVVKNLYRHVLGRTVDPGGLQTYTATVAKNGVQTVVDTLLASGEYQQNFGEYGVPGAERVQYCGSSGTSGRVGDLRGDFRSMDANRDGRIERREWSGTAREFGSLDRNRDGVISRQEFRGVGSQSQAVGTSGLAQSIDWTRAGFSRLDSNRDGVITAAEWPYDLGLFNRADTSRDGALSPQEFLRAATVNEAPAGTAGASVDFQRLDRNRDGRVERNEWYGTASEFDRIDRNHNNVLTRDEYESRSVSDRSDDFTFTDLDRNRDGRITVDEWNWNRRTFNRQDTNGDGSIMPWEFTGAPR